MMSVDYQEERLRPGTRGATRESDSTTLSVSGAMALARGALEGVVVRLVGEVSEVSCKPGYKAAYFTIKDKNASLPCMMWNNRYQATGISLAVGQLIELSGRFTLYAPKGRMSFDVFSLALAGEGKLRQQVADLARKLDAEGLMNPARKRPLPSLPERIGLVTSPRGAAVHDVLRTLKRRFPLSEVLVAGVAVEGQNAPSGIIEAIACVCAAGAEVVLVVRGGGSFEDLMPFNDEQLARAIAACPVPVVTGIGHEPDTSIADMVADLRASTPTAAAETVTPARENLSNAFESRARAMSMAVERSLERERASLRRLSERPLFRDSSLLFATEAQTLDLAADKLGRALPVNLEKDRVRLAATADRLRVVLPRVVERESVVLGRAKERLSHILPLAVSTQRQRIASLHDRLAVCGPSVVSRFEAEAGLAAARLHDLSPLAILGRGYSIARTTEGAVVKQIDQAVIGSVMNVAVSDGEIACRVEDVRHIETSVEPWEESL